MAENKKSNSKGGNVVDIGCDRFIKEMTFVNADIAEIDPNILRILWNDKHFRKLYENEMAEIEQYRELISKLEEEHRVREELLKEDNGNRLLYARRVFKTSRSLKEHREVERGLCKELSNHVQKIAMSLQNCANAKFSSSEEEEKIISETVQVYVDEIKEIEKGAPAIRQQIKQFMVRFEDDYADAMDFNALLQRKNKERSDREKVISLKTTKINVTKNNVNNNKDKE